MFRHHLAQCLALCLALCGCHLEPPDPAAEVAAIMDKHPASFVDRVTAMEALVSRQFPPANPAPVVLAESLAVYRQRILRVGFANQSPEEKSESVAHFLFDSLQLTSVDSGDALDLSLPSRILAQRRGSCVGLALLILALAEELRLPANPVLLPGHLFVRIHPQDGPARNVELLRKGIARSDSFYRATFQLSRRPWYTLADEAPDQALAALVFNLANAHRREGRRDDARGEYQRVLERLPNFPDALGCLGALDLAEGKIPDALAKLHASLNGDSLSEPALATLKKAMEFSGKRIQP